MASLLHKHSITLLTMSHARLKQENTGDTEILNSLYPNSTVHKVRITDSDKLNLVKFGYGGLILGSIQF